MSKILIVSKTRMANDRVCVGGIDIDNNISVRLLNINGYYESADTCQFNIREIWDVDYSKHNQRPLPHSEDICVMSKKKSGELKSEISMLDMLTKIQFHVCKGSLFMTFEGKLKSTDSGTLYISEDSVPNNSTCFWVCDREIRRSDYKGKVRYNYQGGTRQWGINISYAGLEDKPAQIIPQGTLTRLSLAHWWSPPEDSDTEERCYLQLSGWYE